jgi:cell division protein FtsQ
VLADDPSTEDSFYRPATRKPAASRTNLGPVPFRDKKKHAFDAEDDEPFLRSRRRVAVRRGILPQSVWGRVGFTVGALVALGGLVWLGYTVRDLAVHDPRFRIESSENIQLLGNSQVTEPELLSVFGSDMGRNVFFVPLRERRAQLEQLPWVSTATVMRLLPNQLRVAVTERTPIAFVRNGNTIGLVDRDGVLLTMPPEMMAAKHYSFPVVTGVSEKDPASTRAAQMKIYQRFISEIDSAGEKVSSELSEVDLSDPEDVKALVPAGNEELLLLFGDEDFLARWHNYQQHLTEWQAQYPRLASVDLRYERQVVLEMRKEAPAQLAHDSAGKSAETSAKPAAKSKTAKNIRPNGGTARAISPQPRGQ